MLRVVFLGVDLFVLLEVLGPLEALVADLAGVGLEGDVYAEVGGDVVALGARGAAFLPFAGEAEVASALAADVVVAEMIVERLGV